VVQREFAGKDFDGPVTSAELQRLGRAAAKVTDHSDLIQMLQVLSFYGVDVDFQKEEGFVNLRTLSDDALKAFMTCVKERFRAQKLPYPT
jgi:exo-beta-1,3-glucanase (GH17 family)